MKKLWLPLIIFIFFVNNLVMAQQTASKMEEKKYSTEIIRYNVPEAERPHFEKSYHEAGNYLQSSPYCLGYQIIHGSEEPNHYIVIIHWTSEQDHLQGFRKSSAFMPFFNLVKPFFNNIEEMKHYNPTSNVWRRG